MTEIEELTLQNEKLKDYLLAFLKLTDRKTMTIDIRDFREARNLTELRKDVTEELKL